MKDLHDKHFRKISEVSLGLAKTMKRILTSVTERDISLSHLKDFTDISKPASVLVSSETNFSINTETVELNLK